MAVVVVMAVMDDRPRRGLGCLGAGGRRSSREGWLVASVSCAPGAWAFAACLWGNGQEECEIIVPWFLWTWWCCLSGGL